MDPYSTSALPHLLPPPTYSSPSKQLRLMTPGSSCSSRTSSSCASSYRRHGARRSMRRSRSQSYMHEMQLPAYASPTGAGRPDYHYMYPDARGTNSHWNYGESPPVSSRCRTPSEHYRVQQMQPTVFRPPGWQDWQRGPAGMAATSEGAWRNGGMTSWGAGFGVNRKFTKDNFFNTAKQSHGTDLRHITRASPNQVRRVI
eukprot:TRINITY_DN98923_c0_g1_i1.p1 TRINITY_DN98923_c0_g1~~TRINITY_DN98923_c0_g1_i1.p1  ORF type:complete len:207 (-),score=13.38 TRINITY_DN98923_c0_g1_i1:39-638(-)